MLARSPQSPLRASLARTALVTPFIFGLGCGTAATSGSGGGTSAAATTGAGPSSGTTTVTSSGAVTGATTGSAAVTSSSSGGTPPTAADLLALTTQCNQISNGLYKASSSATADIPICGLVGAVFWKADMDIDCDGKMSTQCNINTDPYYQNQTSATDSGGNPLDSATLPYVVIPGKSSRFDYSANGIAFGTVIAVIYNGKVAYGVFGDTGPTSIIGEGSVALATALGIDPDPSTGGVGSGVTYIAFTGANAVNAPIEDASHATTLGQSLAASLVASGGH